MILWSDLIYAPLRDFTSKLSTFIAKSSSNKRSNDMIRVLALLESDDFLNAQDAPNKLLLSNLYAMLEAR